MSSKRGRKRNDNLPPNRARDVQRAFRARRAAHLQALEQRVSELEEENDCLRQALNLPPANRPPLGKGPTGKDKPKNADPSGASTSNVSASVNSLLSSRGSSSADSPSSTRAGSHSPPVLSAAPRSAQPSIENTPAWDQGMLIGEQHNGTPGGGHHHHHSVDSTTYQLPPMSAPPQQGKAPPQQQQPQQLQYQYTSSASPIPPSRTPSLPSSVYMNYSHSADRPMANSSYPGPSTSSSYSVRADEDVRHYASYPPPSSYDSPTSMHHHHTHHHLQHPAAHREPSSPALSYPPRRESGGGYFPHLSNTGNSPHSIRLPSPPGGLMPQQQQPPRPYENRLHPMS